MIMPCVHSESDDGGDEISAELPECASSAVPLSDSSFDAETATGRWIVFFYTQWCDTCHAACEALDALPGAVSRVRTPLIRCCLGGFCLLHAAAFFFFFFF
jgi:hypothetical protein